jgi:hypothetical protein
MSLSKILAVFFLFRSRAAVTVGRNRQTALQQEFCFAFSKPAGSEKNVLKLSLTNKN